jgi:hypothetical protein
VRHSNPIIPQLSRLAERNRAKRWRQTFHEFIDLESFARVRRDDDAVAVSGKRQNHDMWVRLPFILIRQS